MGDSEFRSPDQTAGGQNWADIGKTAAAARRRLLAEHPELETFQAEIDRLLTGAGSTENRLAVLRFLVESKLRELHDEIQKLQQQM